MNTSFSKIEKLIDRMIVEMNGSENVVRFLDLILNDSSETEERVSKYITLAVANYFKISTDELIDEGGKGREEASYRVICYRLHKDILEFSIRETARVYKRKENAIFRGLKRISDIEENPKIDIKIYQAFMKIQEHVKKLHSHLEEDKIKENEKKKS